MIPRKLHRIWFGGDMPDEFADYGRDWRRLHPDWQLCEWGEWDGLDLRHRDLIDRAYDVFPHDHRRFIADILRLELLDRFGGVYADTDVQPLRPIDGLLDNVECFVAWSPNRGPGGGRLLGSAMLGATPGHPFIRACLDAIPDAIRRYRGRPLAQAVGPWHLTRVYLGQRWQTVTAFDEGIFYPRSIAQRDRGDQVDTTGAYAIHHWATTRDKRGRRA